MQSVSVFLFACVLRKLVLKSPVIIISVIAVSIAKAIEFSILEKY